VHAIDQQHRVHPLAGAGRLQDFANGSVTGAPTAQEHVAEMAAGFTLGFPQELAESRQGVEQARLAGGA
jgi:hypothetical protein